MVAKLMYFNMIPVTFLPHYDGGDFVLQSYCFVLNVQKDYARTTSAVPPT